LALTSGGILFGTAVAFLLTRLIGALLYKVNPHDPAAFGTALAVLVITSLAAVLLPARRAAKTGPAWALRE
jgi:ABC-type antimicrobial peptide transport system permease subunit